MSNQSPQRNRKHHSQYSVAPGPGQMQPASRREQSPSPTARERQRYTRTQSLPLVPPLAQLHPTASSSQAPMSHELSPQHTTTSHQSRNSSDDSSLTSVPPPMHAQGHPNQQSQVQNASQPPGSLLYPRPMPGGPLPPFLSGLPEDPTNWQMTEVMLDIERADLQQQAQMRYQAQLQTQVRTSLPPAPGTEGVAYAGGAVSYRYAPESPQRSLPADKSRPQEREREHPSPNASGNSGVIQGDAAPTGTPPTGSPTARKPVPRERGREEVLRDSPRSRPMAQRYRSNSRPLTPEGRDRTFQLQQSVIHPATPPALKKVSTASPLAKAKTPDRSLPVQEEPEEEGGSHHTNNGSLAQRGRVPEVDLHPSEYHRLSPTPSSDLNPMNDLTSSRPRTVHESQKSRNPFRSETDDDQGTLVELDSPQHQPHSEDDEESEGTHTPRSPSTRPLEQNQPASIHDVLARNSQPSQSQQPQHRVGVDTLGDSAQPAFDAAALENAVKKLQGGEQHGSSQTDRRHGQSAQHHQFQPQQQQSSSRRRLNHDDAYMYGQYDQFTQAYQDELESYYDQAAYLQHYLQSPQSRPGAPIPPTPHSNTAAPTPNPPGGLHRPFSRSLIPPFSPAPPGGTPYPYPFSHLRRMQTYPSVSANPTPASHTRGSVNGSIGAYPMHDPLAISEQLALQWQMYAMNNSGAMSDSAWSAFSPSATPYPPGGNLYTPFNAFLARRRASAAPRNDGENDEYLSASRRSSPSHEPVNVPLPPLRGRALRRRGGRIPDIAPRPHVKPPPRVESTQPKETSPEPSSGEETAGEHFAIDIRAPQHEWASNTAEAEADGENGQWVADDGDEDEDDWLDLEFHTSFIGNIDRRRKRFNQRWNELVKAFQALDRETDTTLVLLAAPSHTDQLHSVSSRSIRRDPSLLHSPALANARSSFAQLASQRRTSRSRTASLLQRISAANSSASGTASPSSTASREEDLRRALDTALNSLDALGKIYEGRELRWREEMRRLMEEREGVELLLSQTLGVGFMGPPPA